MILRTGTCLLAALLMALSLSPVRGAEDLLVEDFESDSYRDWKVEGKAFGSRPAEGTLPNQMEVTGYRGKRLVNSYHQGDGTTGTLTSPPFTIRRDYINFLIGGGGYEDETCMKLLVKGEPVRSATGPNTSPGGSERLEWATWDVSDLKGKTARIRIIDRRTGGWGHINVDHILQSSERKVFPKEKRSRTLTVRRRYLNLPVNPARPKTTVRYVVDGEKVRRFNIKLAPEEPAFWVFSDVRPFRGRNLTVTAEALRRGSRGLSALTNTDSIRGAESLYREKWRPQFHFSSRRGWNNDPNGLVYHDGEWHLFYQHNPYGVQWGNMHWGHAVSTDLLHWRELGDELYPWTMAEGACFSGSAVVDAENTAGFAAKGEDALVAAFTDTNRGEAIAWSTDGGRHFTYYKNNPVVTHDGRDPKVFWHEPDERWVMAVYDKRDDSKGVAFYTSPNLKEWTYQSRIDGFYECPELFKLPVDGDENDVRWVLYGADARYVVGRFDGEEFTPGHEGKHRVHYGKYYASQTFNNAPGGRRIQIGWGKIQMPGMPFNQMMTFPCRLTLRTTGSGVRMFAEPIKEIKKLYAGTRRLEDRPLQAGESAEVPTSGRLFDIKAEFEVGGAGTVGLKVGEREVSYDVEDGALDGMPLETRDGRVRVRVLVDRPSIEVCGNDGRVYRTDQFLHGDIEKIGAFAEGGDAVLKNMTVHRLESAWPHPAGDGNSRPAGGNPADDSRASGAPRQGCAETMSLRHRTVRRVFSGTVLRGKASSYFEICALLLYL